jgi:hypothetical protein
MVWSESTKMLPRSRSAVFIREREQCRSVVFSGVCMEEKTHKHEHLRKLVRAWRFTKLENSRNIIIVYRHEFCCEPHDSACRHDPRRYCQSW